MYGLFILFGIGGLLHISVRQNSVLNLRFGCLHFCTVYLYFAAKSIGSDMKKYCTCQRDRNGTPLNKIFHSVRQRSYE